ncbi:MAG: hypothetical protein LBG83_04565 [Oscillospiraceae bacterium]|jgi:hypothetical protein|nr:hypothetical protein [Oscillospiraceae bacterium]
MKKFFALLIAFFTSIFSFLSKPSQNSKPPAATTTTAVVTTTTTTQTQLPAALWTVTVKIDGVEKAFTDLDASKLTAYTLNMRPVNSVGTQKNYTFTGVRLKDVLAYCGKSEDQIGENAELIIQTKDNYATEPYPRDLIVADDTLLAWKEVDHKDTGDEEPNPPTTPRLCPGSEPTNSRYISLVNYIELKG